MNFGQLKKNIFFKILFLIFIFKIVIFGSGYLAAKILPINLWNYRLEFHHYYLDSRFNEPKKINFLNLFNYGDSEWYLDIADNGYQKVDKSALPSTLISTTQDPDRKYIFFPLWPAVIKFFKLFFFDTRLAAFIASNVISFLAFLLFYYLVILYFGNPNLALRAFLLLFFYPFSVFYHLYFTEGLFLLLSLLVFIFLKKGKWRRAYFFAFLLGLTKTYGIFIIIPILIFLIPQFYNQYKIHQFKIKDFLKKTFSLAFIPLSFGSYCLFNYLTKGDWLFFSKVLKEWRYNTFSWLSNLYHNFRDGFSDFSALDFHSFHSSKIEYILMFIILVLVIFSFFKLPKELWAYAFLLWLIPLISKDLMSFGRYLSVAFPIFIFLAMILKDKYLYGLNKFLYRLVLSVFVFSFGLALARIIGWHWVG